MNHDTLTAPTNDPAAGWPAPVLACFDAIYAQVAARYMPYPPASAAGQRVADRFLRSGPTRVGAPDLSLALRWDPRIPRVARSGRSAGSDRAQYWALRALQSQRAAAAHVIPNACPQ